MKCHVPEISWHSRDPILSIDFQPSNDKHRRLASCGTDTHVMIWFVIVHHNGETSLEFRSDLNRHTKTVNAVRFSNNGELLASGDDDANVIIWKQVDKNPGDVFDDTIENKEHWVAQKVLRGHIDDVCDICWSPDNIYLLSGSVDNSAIVWNIEKGKKISLLNENKGFVQGVAWDPRDVYFTTLSSDRSLRIFKVSNKKVAYKIHKAVVPHEGLSDKEKGTRLFYDDTLKSFCRRLAFSPDGELLVTPCGIIEQDSGRVVNTVYVFARSDLSEPAYYLPIGEKPSLVIRFCPIFFKLQTPGVNDDGTIKEEFEEPLISLPYRMVFAVATQKAILLYDTQRSAPFAHISNIHYTRLSDLTWSSDARVLAASSTDGYCSLITFGEKELGEVYDGSFPYKETVENNSDSPSGSKSNSPSEPKNNPAKKMDIFKSSKRKSASFKITGAARKISTSPRTTKAPSEVVIVIDEDSIGDGKNSKQSNGNVKTALEDKKCNGVTLEKGQQTKRDSSKQKLCANSKDAVTSKDLHQKDSDGSGDSVNVCTKDKIVPEAVGDVKMDLGETEQESPDKLQPSKEVCDGASAAQVASDPSSGQDCEMSTSDESKDKKQSPEPSGAKPQSGNTADLPKKAPRRVQLVTLCTKKL
ncbi:chromatin assembly factor 1 subunit B [Rhipicephalus sanguineus]|uniref:chromatin assembly factor 1 subunit B n=1 Tax=Rhipicephalus sanguineus TaxID=34632 RepID=UPI001893AD98|nr:chromatin assembly factor 1 subunit B [Rhipicephalus sanguineus]